MNIIPEEVELVLDKKMRKEERVWQNKQNCNSTGRRLYQNCSESDNRWRFTVTGKEKPFLELFTCLSRVTIW